MRRYFDRLKCPADTAKHLPSPKGLQHEYIRLIHEQWTLISFRCLCYIGANAFSSIKWTCISVDGRCMRWYSSPQEVQAHFAFALPTIAHPKISCAQRTSGSFNSNNGLSISQGFPQAVWDLKRALSSSALCQEAHAKPRQSSHTRMRATYLSLHYEYRPKTKSRQEWESRLTERTFC